MWRRWPELTGKPWTIIWKIRALYEKNLPWYMEQIGVSTNRRFTTGFFYGKPGSDAQIYDSNTYVKDYTYLGIAGEKNAEGLYRLEQKNKFSVGEQIEIMKPDGRNIPVVVKRIVNEDGEDQGKCTPCKTDHLY